MVGLQEAYLLEENSTEPDLRVQLVDAFKADLHVQVTDWLQYASHGFTHSQEPMQLAM